MILSARPSWAVVLAAGVGAVYGGLVAWAVTTNEYNAWGSLLLLPVVVAVNVVFMRVANRRETTQWLYGIMLAGFTAKMLGSLVRYLVAYIVYDRSSDAERYNRYAAYNYPLWRAGHMDWNWSFGEGTHNMERLTTAIYALTGPSPIVGFAIYSSFAFWGAYLLFRAFEVALPEGDHRRYALLIFFLPSLLYWPSSIGKEAWLMLFVGVTALGAAKFFARDGGLVLLGVGALGTALMRPHISVLLFSGLLIAQLFRPTRRRSTDAITKLAGLGVMLVAAFVLAKASATLLGIDDLSAAAVSDGIDMAAGRTTQGGSEFKAVQVSSPISFIGAVVTVLFRPFPWESLNAQMLVQSLEGAFLVVLAWKSRSRLRQLVRTMRTHPYVTFSVVYALGFIVAFSGFSNFGILARQRVLMIPFVLVLLALPKKEPQVQPAPGDQLDHSGWGGSTPLGYQPVGRGRE